MNQFPTIWQSFQAAKAIAACRGIFEDLMKTLGGTSKQFRIIRDAFVRGWWKENRGICHRFFGLGTERLRKISKQEGEVLPKPPT